MPKKLQSQIRVAELRRVFRSDEEQLVDAHIARLCVLYEDLRIELKGVSAASIPLLDTSLIQQRQKRKRMVLAHTEDITFSVDL